MPENKPRHFFPAVTTAAVYVVGGRNYLSWVDARKAAIAQHVQAVLGHEAITDDAVVDYLLDNCDYLTEILAWNGTTNR